MRRSRSSPANEDDVRPDLLSLLLSWRAPLVQLISNTHIRVRITLIYVNSRSAVCPKQNRPAIGETGNLGISDRHDPFNVVRLLQPEIVGEYRSHPDRKAGGNPSRNIRWRQNPRASPGKQLR